MIEGLRWLVRIVGIGTALIFIVSAVLALTGCVSARIEPTTAAELHPGDFIRLSHGILRVERIEGSRAIGRLVKNADMITRETLLTADCHRYEASRKFEEWRFIPPGKAKNVTANWPCE